MKKTLCVRTGLAFAVLVAGLSFAALFYGAVTDAQARERDRTLKVLFTHTGEKGEFTFKRNGRYDRAVLDKLNTILRDWRRNEPTRMDPQLFDLLWEVYQRTGSKEYIHVVSGYRSLATNNMLRRRSRGVAKRSRHTQGQAIDFFIPGVPVSNIRKIGLQLQNGGVGYYPSSNSPFVHLDTGSIRHWPRMTRAQLAAVFPNGETVHVPSDGKPLPGYERALAKLDRNRKTTTVAYLDSSTRSIRLKDDDQEKVTVGKWLKKVFAGGVDEEEDNTLAGTGDTPAAPLEPEFAVAGATPGTDDELSPAPLPRAVPSRKRLILVAAAERSQVAAADELAMVALLSTPQTPPARAAATGPANAPDNSAARFEIAGLADEDGAIAAPDRSALATLYLAAASRAAALAPEKARAEAVVTAALPTSRPAEPASTEPAIADKAQESYSLASYSPAAPPPPVALPKPAPAASAADTPGSAIAAANALGLMGTLDSQPVNPAKKIELAYALAYASANTTSALDRSVAKPRPRQQQAATNAAGTAGTDSGSAPAYPAVTVNAHLTTATPGANGMRQLMSYLTTRTRSFALLAQPRPDRVPGFFVAPKTAAEAILPTTFKPPRTDRFTVEGNRPKLRISRSRLAGLF